MKTKLNPMELAPLADFINDCYDGNLARISNDVDQAIYLLHLVKKDEVEPEKIENISFTLYQIGQQLFSSYLRKAKD
ncbi:MAG: hypothetical protein WBA74_04265 [Cyclobacteriaceae bacterium]